MMQEYGKIFNCRTIECYGPDGLNNCMRLNKKLHDRLETVCNIVYFCFFTLRPRTAMTERKVLFLSMHLNLLDQIFELANDSMKS